MTSAPEILARYDLDRVQPPVTPAALPRDQSQVGLCLFSGALRCYDTPGSLLWESHPKGLNFTAIITSQDLNGDGETEILLQAGRPTAPYGAAVMVSLVDGRVLWRYDVEPMSYQWYLYAGDYLPDSPTPEIMVIMMGYPPDKDNGYIAVFESPEPGTTPVQRWRYDFDQYTCFPSLLQTDLDGDGRKELVVETHSRMWFLDAETGAMKHFVQWDVSPANVRSYGLVEFVDLNRDGREDFLCIADFAQHHEVLLNDNGKMTLAWTHGWPESVTTGKVATVWPKPPYVDLDGDGQYEIIVSMFNSEDEGAWLIRAYDALTGVLKYRFPGAITVSTGDLDGDGKAEVLANASSDPTGTACSGARLLRVKDGVFEAFWQDDRTTAIETKADAVFRVVRESGKYALRFGENGMITEAPWKEPELPLGPNFAGIPAIQGPPEPAVLVADLTGDSRNEIILFREPQVEVLCYGDKSLARVAQYDSTAVPVIADFDGDGRPELALTTVRVDAAPMVEVIAPHAENAVVWRTQLPPPARAGLPQPRKAYLRAGRFTGKATPDLYLWAGTPIVRSAVLEGATGTVVWDRGEIAGLSRYWGPSMNLASVYDYDADGNQDVIFTNPDYYCVASGATGEFLLGPLFPPDIFHQPSQGLYTLPAILDMEEGDPMVCLAAGHYFQAAMSLRARPYWHALPPTGQNRCAQEGFLRLPEGRWAMGFGRQNGNFACLNVADGTVRWELPVEATCSDVTVCDVDGDGRMEFLFGTSHGFLYAVQDAGNHGKILWEVRGDAAWGAPIPADVNGDGVSELMVSSTDGYVFVLGVKP